MPLTENEYSLFANDNPQEVAHLFKSVALDSPRLSELLIAAIQANAVNIFRTYFNPSGREFYCARNNSDTRQGIYLQEIAATQGKIDILRVLYDEKQINAHTDRSEHEQSVVQPLRDAVKNGHTDCVRYLLEKGMDYRELGVFHNHLGGEVPYFLYALLQGYEEIAEILIEKDQGKFLINYALEWMGERVWQTNQSCISKREPIIQFLSDRAMGVDLSDWALKVLYSVKTPGLSLLGISYKGEPLKSISEAHIATQAQLDALQDDERKAALRLRLDRIFQQRGKFETETGAINCVSIIEAARHGKETTLEFRLSQQSHVNLDEIYEAIDIAFECNQFSCLNLLTSNPKIAPEKIMALRDKLEAKIFSCKEQNTRGGSMSQSSSGSSTETEEASKLIRELSVKPSIINRFHLKKHNTKLYRAVLSGDVDEVAFLLDHGADPNRGTTQGDTALCAANRFSYRNYIDKHRQEAYQKYAIIVANLLERGGNPDLFFYSSALENAAQVGNTDCIRILLPYINKESLCRVPAYSDGVGDKDVFYAWLCLPCTQHYFPLRQGHFVILLVY